MHTYIYSTLPRVECSRVKEDIYMFWAAPATIYIYICIHILCMYIRTHSTSKGHVILAWIDDIYIIYYFRYAYHCAYACVLRVK